MDRFLGTGHFFLDPVAFRESALNQLPFGDPNRPSPAVLCAVYLCGSTTTDDVQPSAPSVYTPDAFLACCLQNIHPDMDEVPVRPHTVLDLIQAEVLLSHYYMHVALPVQGYYHCAAAVSLALGAGLHLIGSDSHPNVQASLFATSPSTIPSELDATLGVSAFRAVAILNSYWVALSGTPSLIPDEFNIDITSLLTTRSPVSDSFFNTNCSI
jgi:hypothetical protein